MNFYFDAGILQVPHYAGCQIYAHNLIAEIAKVGPEHTFHLHLAMPGWNDRIGELTALPNVVPHVQSGPIGRHLGMPLGILKTRSKALYILNGNSGKLRVPVSVPTAVLFHDMRNVLCADIYGKEFCDGFANEARSWIFKRDLIVTGAETVKREMIDYFNLKPSKILVASESTEHHGHGDGESLPAQMPAGDPPFFLMVNPGEVRKNWQDTLVAFALYLRQHPDDTRTVLVLAGNLREETQPLHARLANDELLAQRTILLGYISDDELRYLYRHARFSIYPSRYEGFGIPILESMGQDLPIIVSDIPVFREVAGEGAYFVPLDKPDVMADAFFRLNTDDALRADLIAKGRQRVAHYSWRRSAQDTLDALVALAAR